MLFPCLTLIKLSTLISKIRDTAKGTNLMTVLQEARTSYEAEEVISREVRHLSSVSNCINPS